MQQHDGDNSLPYELIQFTYYPGDRLRFRIHPEIQPAVLVELLQNELIFEMEIWSGLAQHRTLLKFPKLFLLSQNPATTSLVGFNLARETRPWLQIQRSLKPLQLSAGFGYVQCLDDQDRVLLLKEQTMRF